MKIKELCDALSLELVTGHTDNEFTNVYVGDFLSRAMTKVKPEKLWITIMANTNVIAVASLTDAPAVLLAEGVKLQEEALEAAKENGVCVLSSNEDAYSLCLAIGKLLKQ